jgi:hypothetical protein
VEGGGWVVDVLVVAACPPLLGLLLDHRSVGLRWSPVQHPVPGYWGSPGPFRDPQGKALALPAARLLYGIGPLGW